MKAKVTACIVAGGVLVAVAALTAEPTPFSRIVAFGTSLSDPGNAFALAGGVNVPPHYDMDLFLVPQVPYARGGHHITNGATWVEQLARARGLSGTVRPAYRGSESNATNFAVGAARAYEDGRNVNLPAQVEEFLARFGQAAPADALYAIEMGGNDIRDALAAYANQQDGAAILQAATLSIAANIQRLYFAGARQFLVWRTPDVGLTPAARAAGPQAALLATQLTIAFNAGLDQVVAQLSVALPGISIVRLDAYALINGMVQDPGSYGLSNVVDPCVMPDVQPFFCQNPDEYLFWDGIHPTRAVHGIVAQEAARVLLLN